MYRRKMSKLKIGIIMLAPLFLFPSLVDAEEGIDLVRKVRREALRCTEETDSSPRACFAKASPNKCESLVYSWFGSRGDARRDAERAWAYCVRSCADAGFFSRTVGRCARETNW